MRSVVAITAAMLCGSGASAESLVAAQTLGPQHVIGPRDVVFVDRTFPGAVSDIDSVLGRETIRVVYAGQPVRLQDTRPPALINRNQIVVLIFENNGLRILAEGRSLARGAEGEIVDVMNLSSRSKITGVVTATGQVRVSP